MALERGSLSAKLCKEVNGLLRHLVYFGNFRFSNGLFIDFVEIYCSLRRIVPSFKDIVYFISKISMLLIFTALFVEILSKKPNVLFIMLDDLGWGDVSWNNDKVIVMI